MQKKKMAVIFQGLVYFGDKDPWIDPDEIRELCNVKKMRYRIIEGPTTHLRPGMYIEMWTSSAA